MYTPFRSFKQPGSLFRSDDDILPHSTQHPGGQVIPAAWLRLFSPAEVNQLLAGGVGGGGLDLADMRAHAVYSGGFSPTSSTVRLFWKARALTYLTHTKGIGVLYPT